MTTKRSFLILSLFIVHTCAQLSLEDMIRNVFNGEPTVVETSTQRHELKQWKPQTSEVTRTLTSCGVDKECVPRHLCVNGDISTTGEYLMNIHDHENGCSYSEICCDISNKKTESVIPAVPKERHEGCGWRNPDGIGFKITGDEDNLTQFGEYPWMVAILRIEDFGGEKIKVYTCGGSLIAPNVVLTAANCVYKRDIDNIIVRGGEWDTQSNNEILSHVDKSVKEIITHENYNRATMSNGVALLILKEPFEWQENIRPVCLPELNANFDNNRCYVTTWGKDKPNGNYQVILKKVELPIVPHETCQNYLRQTRLGLLFSLHESFLCAGGEKGKDVCLGAGGSPLVCPIPGVKNRFYQAGIVAWGVGCAEENVPGVYVNVTSFRPWISEKLTARDITNSHFTP